MARLAKYLFPRSAIAVGLFITFMSLTSGRAGVTFREMDELIKKEIPFESSHLKVCEFLNSRKINSSGYNVGLDPLYGLPTSKQERKRYITARIPENPDPSRSRYDIFVVFYFDEDQNLIDYKLQQLDNVP
jgi:hypothetical protein